MTHYSVIVAIAALQDIAQARLWLAERSPDAAEHWFNRLYDTIGSLEIFPERCPLAPETGFLNVEIRELFHGRRQNKYRILFTIRDAEVHVLHVRHGARLALGETESADE
jgi:plasmid stabilization system protein ParE